MDPIRNEGRLGVAAAGARRTPLFTFLILSVFATSVYASASVSLEPLAAPTLQDCYFLPDPRNDTPLFCGADNSVTPAFVNTTVRFNVSASDPEKDNITFTFYFERYRPNATTGLPEFNPDSPVRNVTVTPPDPVSPAWANTTWEYQAVGNLTSMKYFVYIEVRDAQGELGGTRFFPVVVNRNSEPFMDGLLSVNSVSPPITYQKKEVPPLFVNVSVGDFDVEPLTVTWNWSDGTYTVNLVPASSNSTPVTVSHVYDASLFPLNETPRTVNLTFSVWVDDGVGHNVSSTAIAQYEIEWDFWPNIDVNSLSPSPGSRWKVGEQVPIEGTWTDPEGDPLTFFIDFDDRIDGDGDGKPAMDRDFIGNQTSHAYMVPGNYSVTLWATDGVDKKFCLDRADCTQNFSHWRSQTIPFNVGPNRRPIVALSNHSAFADEPVVLRVVVFDPDGDSLTVTWNFGDGTETPTNVTTASRESPQTPTLHQSHIYAHVGRHNLTVEVSDGNETINMTREVIVESFNLPPNIIQIQVLRANLTSAGNNTFQINETVVLRITLYDPEGDDLEIRVDWADGNVSVMSVNVTAGPDCIVDELNRTLCSFTVSHAYGDPEGSGKIKYTINVTVTDDNEYLEWNYTAWKVERIQSHVGSLQAPLFINDPVPVVPDVWDVWDFSTFTVIVGIPIFLVTRWAWRVRKERKEE